MSLSISMRYENKLITYDVIEKSIKLNGTRKLQDLFALAEAEDISKRTVKELVLRSIRKSSNEVQSNFLLATKNNKENIFIDENKFQTRLLKILLLGDVERQELINLFGKKGGF